MLKVVCLNLKIYEDRHNFADGYFRTRFEKVEKTRNIFLKIQLDFNRLELRTSFLPNIPKALVGKIFELVQLNKELVHIFDTLIEQDFSLIFYFQKNKLMCL
jgi:hypothetical protein